MFRCFRSRLYRCHEDGAVDGTGVDADGKVTEAMDILHQQIQTVLELDIESEYACALFPDGDGIQDERFRHDNDGILDIVECNTGGANLMVDGSFEGYTPTTITRGLIT